MVESIKVYLSKQLVSTGMGRNIISQKISLITKYIVMICNWLIEAYIYTPVLDKLLETLLNGLLKVPMASQYFKDTQMRG